MLFVSKKKYDIARENLKVINEQKMWCQNEYTRVQKELQDQTEMNKDLCNRLEYMEEVEKDLKKEISRLKSLCTKHGVSYQRKEEKK